MYALQGNMTKAIFKRKHTHTHSYEHLSLAMFKITGHLFTIATILGKCVAYSPISYDAPVLCVYHNSLNYVEKHTIRKDKFKMP